MKQKENISRREALKRMAQTAMVAAVASIFPNGSIMARDSDGYVDNKYVDRCYNDYTNYDNYSNHKDYYNYGNYRDYRNYHNYQNYSDATSK